MARSHPVAGKDCLFDLSQGATQNVLDVLKVGSTSPIGEKSPQHTSTDSQRQLRKPVHTERLPGGCPHRDFSPGLRLPVLLLSSRHLRQFVEFDANVWVVFAFQPRQEQVWQA